MRKIVLVFLVPVLTIVGGAFVWYEALGPHCRAPNRPDYLRRPDLGRRLELIVKRHRLLTPQQREMYNRAADAWQSVLRNIDAALEVTNGGPRP
jgi:hypothetical protein